MRSRSTRATRTRTFIWGARTLRAGTTGRRRRFSSARKLESRRIPRGSARPTRSRACASSSRGNPPTLRPHIRRRSRQVPGNLTARVGVTRLSAFMPASTTAAAPAPAGDLDQPAPREPEIPTAPDEPPIPPAPQSHRLRQHTEHDADTRNRIFMRRRCGRSDRNELARHRGNSFEHRREPGRHPSRIRRHRAGTRVAQSRRHDRAGDRARA